MKKRKIIISAVALTAIAVITVSIIAIKSKSRHNAVPRTEKEVESQQVTVEKIPDENQDDAGIVVEDDGSGLKPDETAASLPQNNTGEKAEAPAKAKQPEKAEEAAQPITTGGNSGYVQDADPNTGISYDGKSPIIYTYEDGSKGTERKKGATYEVSPGLIRYYYPPDEVPWDGTCSHCGKVAGDGLNGTCVRWLMCDITCPNCGVFVKQGECHTCKEE